MEGQSVYLGLEARDILMLLRGTDCPPTHLVYRHSPSEICICVPPHAQRVRAVERSSPHTPRWGGL